MADQSALAADFDWRERENKRQEERAARDKANREDPTYVEFFEAYADYAGKRAAKVLYAVAKELKKQPVLRGLLDSTAMELDTLFFVVPEWPDVKERLEAGSDQEKEIRYLLGSMPEIQASGTATGHAVIAEIVYERERLDRLWERIEAAEREHGRTPETEGLVEAWQLASLEAIGGMHHAILAGRVDAIEAIRAMKSDKAIDLNAPEHPELRGGARAERFSTDPEVEKLERQAITAMADLAREQVQDLPIKSEWRDFFISLSALDSAERVAALDRRLAGEDDGTIRFVCTAEERKAAESWIVHKVEDAVEPGFVDALIDGTGQWVPLLRAIRDKGDLTVEQAVDLRQVAGQWADTYSKELDGLAADHVDRPGAERSMMQAVAIMAALDAEGVSVDA